MDINEKNHTEANAGEQAASDRSETQETKGPLLSMEKKDLITSVVLIVFSLYLLGTGIYMFMTTMELSDSPWYGTPGMFPIFIGATLLILSAIMLGSLLKAGVRLDRDSVEAVKSYFMGRRFRRTLVAIGFLAIYIFVLFGNIDFNLATFVYLCATMLYFREKTFAIWKIVLICAAFTAFLYLFFGILAGVPLP